MSGFLKIHNLNNIDGDEISRLQYWQIDGYHGNYIVGMNKVVYLSLIPFYFETESGLSVSQFKIRKIIGFERGAKVTGTETDLTTSWLVSSSGTYKTRWIFYANNDIVYPGAGAYEFYIKFDDDSEYISEPFCMASESDFYSCLPDYNNDYNNDYLTCN